MKKVFLLVTVFSIMAAAFAQTKPQAKTSAPITNKSVPVNSKTTLKTLNDSVSYAIGVSVASFYKQQGITSLNSALVSKAINDVLAGKKAILDEETCNTVVTKMMTSMQETKSKPTIESGKAFLAKNKTRPEIKTTASGIQYEVITEGTGLKPLAKDSVTVNYRGTLIDGTEFDNSYTRGEPITFPLNRVIPGWTEGLQLMSVGSKYKLYIPYTLAYGSNDQGPIPGGSTLIFEVELLDVKQAK
ncbi:MAG: FKBP-type peptidyl-prolyl cis-trans isomerase [Chitinophagaceae bacterium]